jgi:glycosyltransferase involved in cell wall biosynthesis
MERPVPRVLVLSEIPTPYRLPLYRRLADSGRIDLELAFLAAGEPDRPWRLERELAEVRHRVLHGYAPHIRTRRNTFVYELNPGIVRVLREERWDVIVIGGYSVFAEQVAIAYARATRTPFILHSESHLRKPRHRAISAAKRAVVPAVVGSAAAGFATGSAATRYLEHYGMQSSRIRIVPNTIDVAGYALAADMARSDAKRIRQELQLPEQYVLYVGRLVEAKGLLDLTAALAVLGDSAPTIVAAGEGPLAEALAATKRVRLVGFQETQRLIELYALADAFVLPSLDEPWGVVVNEALACSCPVITTDAVGAADDLVADGVNGRVVAAGDVAALAAALRPPYPTGKDQRIDRWTYEFGVEQFLEGIEIALR